MLDKEEQRRYSRQTILPEIGNAGQLKLKSAKIMVIGAGGLGCILLQYLAAAGIGEIGIIDDDKVDETNLHRQILYSIQDIGKAKVSVAKAKLNLLNPHVKINAFEHRLNSDNAVDLLKSYDLIVDGSDNFQTRYLVNDTCVALDKPLVFGSIFKFEGQVSVFNYLDGPNYRDVFPEPPGLDELPNCSDVGVLGILPGIIGLYMANEVIKVTCEIGELLSGILMTINVLENTTNYYKISKSTRSFKTPLQEYYKTTEEIDKQTLDQWIIDDEGELQVIDVRENHEYEEYNIGGINIPLYQLKERLASFTKSKKIVFVCETGQRSKIAVQLSKSISNVLVYSLTHGLSSSI
ncbi:MAG: thiamine biosynthesis protein ThiF [Pedobacter sp.]|nr:MAG: thiamine biosynthesis protein ThiF [Pedobacter sp.]